MEIEKFVHNGVKADGTFEDRPGAVVVGGSVRMSTGEVLPRTNDGKVEGIRCHLTKKEMDKLLQKHIVED